MYNFVDINEKQFHIERNIFQNFLSAPGLEEDAKRWKNRQGPLQILMFIQKFPT